MLKVEQVEFDIRLWPLLKGDLVLPRLVLRKPQIEIEVGDKEQLNWSMGETPVARELSRRSSRTIAYETPLIGMLEITDGMLGYRDPKRKLELDGTVSTATGKAGEQAQAELQLERRLEANRLACVSLAAPHWCCAILSSPIQSISTSSSGRPSSKPKVRCTIPSNGRGADVDLTLQGPNLSDIYPLLGIPGPPTPPYLISGKLERGPGLWKFVKSKWRVGETTSPVR